MSLEDQAEELIALFQAEGAVNSLNSIGTVTSTAAVTLPDVTASGYNVATLGSNANFTLPNASQGKRLRLKLIQDATGSRTAAFAVGTGSIQWVGHAAPTLTTTGGRADLLVFECWDGTNWIGTASLNV